MDDLLLGVYVGDEPSRSIKEESMLCLCCMGIVDCELLVLKFGTSFIFGEYVVTVSSIIAFVRLCDGESMSYAKLLSKSSSKKSSISRVGYGGASWISASTSTG